MKTVMLTARIEPELKNQAEEILQKLGVSTTQAITMYYSQIILNKGIPFKIEIPNRETQKAIDDVMARVDVNDVTDIGQLYEDMDL